MKRTTNNSFAFKHGKIVSLLFLTFIKYISIVTTSYPPFIFCKDIDMGLILYLWPCSLFSIAFNIRQINIKHNKVKHIMYCNIYYIVLWWWMCTFKIVTLDLCCLQASERARAELVNGGVSFVIILRGTNLKSFTQSFKVIYNIEIRRGARNLSLLTILR